jgi:chaperonin cofactor prefoldin
MPAAALQGMPDLNGSVILDLDPTSGESSVSSGSGSSGTNSGLSGGGRHDGALVVQPDASSLQMVDASRGLIPVPKGQRYVDVTGYLNMSQTEAAKQLKVPPSTLSKRWKEAVRNRKWPYRRVQKLDKEITTLLHNVPQGASAPPLPPHIEEELAKLLQLRQKEMQQVIIRL